MNIHKIEPKTDPEVMGMVEQLMELAKDNRLAYLVICAKSPDEDEGFAAYAGLSSVSDTDEVIAKLERMKHMLISDTMKRR